MAMGVSRSGVRLVAGLLAAVMAMWGETGLVRAQELAPAPAPAPAGGGFGTFWVYVGTYSEGARDRGIFLMDLDARTGKLGAPRLAAASPDPSFLAIHPSRQYLYAANESGAIKGRRDGGVSAFAIDQASGALELLNQQLPAGSGPCHLVVDRQGQNVLVANYGSGSVGCLPIDRDGRLRPASSKIQHRGQGGDPSRQSSPHAHSINLDAANRFAVAADLGLDKILIYAFDPARGRLTPHEPPFTKVAPASGPRHFAFHPEGRFGYVIDEMANTVIAFAYDADAGTLTEMQTISTLPAGFRGKSYTAEVQVHPTGRFLYGSNRGHDSIAVFAIDPTSGKLTLAGITATQGKNPRNFAIDPTGAWLFAENQDSNSIVVFKIDPQAGTLEPTGQTVKVPKPVCIKMMPRPAGATR